MLGILLQNMIDLIGVTTDRNNIGFSLFALNCEFSQNIEIKIRDGKFYLSYNNMNVIANKNNELILTTTLDPLYFIIINGVFVTEMNGQHMYIAEKSDKLYPLLCNFENFIIHTFNKKVHKKDDTIVNSKTSCIIKHGTHHVCKISSRDLISVEYRNSLELDNLEYRIEEINSEEKKQLMIDYLHPRYVRDMVKLIMPIIEGESIYNYILPYVYRSSLIVQLYSGSNIYINEIPKNIVIKVCLSLIALYEEIIILNNKRIFHNDLHMSNIIYNENTNLSSLIDFQTLTKDSPSTCYRDINGYELYDLDVMKINIKYILLCGCINSEFYEEIKNFGMIEGDKFDISMFSKGENFTNNLKTIFN